jgi:phage gpG-like protein
MGGFNDLFKALSTIPEGVEKATQKGLKRGAVIVMGKAKQKLGTYQPASGGYPAWKLLSPLTVARKYTIKSGQHKGFLNKKGVELAHQPGGWKVGSTADGPLVESGHLRQAITTDDSDLSHGVMYVGVAAGSPDQGKGSPGDYAAAHEFGYAPKNIPPRPYLRPALEESKEQIKEEVTKALLEGLRGIGK